MKLTGERQINASREAVFAALNDPEILRRSIPGCEAINARSATEMDAKVTMKIGPVTARFSGEVELTDLDPPVSYTIIGKGSGGAAGFVKGTAKIGLGAEGEGTRLSYDVHADIGGKLAQLGGRMLDGTARKLSDQFFDNFCQLLGEPEERASEEIKVDPARPAYSKNSPAWLLALCALAAAAAVAAYFLYR